ncbi:hypothetical protein Q8W71_00940 [Methylobacterium sp. NEAU 140]|uniref:hypothetical protein n=1 Tax=Methylobacterium sp. NEAU 140 TaxID=3064945 RepID=UPI0027368B5C|nr:hypothetical protein [Methylobacterium sp. NEAU 140]MDP4021175.1 hypothetical protein [Methylobacterium sp. NEAU 140]
MSDGVYSIDIAVRATPSPALVARIVDSYGADAAAERWAWLGERTISTLAQRGRAQAGDVAPRRTGGRPMACSEIDAAVAVEAGFILGSASRGIRAAGVTVSYQGLYSRRGLTPPMISPEERGIASALAGAARRGDAEAAEAWEARLAFEASVGFVIRKALALVAEQTVSGRYALPPADAALAEALRDEDPAAVALVFPGLAEISQAEPEPPVIVPPPTPETAPMRRMSRMPTDNVLTAERAQGRSVDQMASDWEVKPAAIRAALRRIDQAALASQVQAPPPKPLSATHSEPAQHLAAPPPGRLSVEDLARAVALARREGITPAAAVEFVRADVDQARTRPVAPDPDLAGFPAPRMSPGLAAWFDALAAGHDLPELEMEDFDV